MEKQCILSIGREFGSGGHLIGKKLSEHYHLPFYDYDLLKNIASEKNLDLKLLESYDERPRNRFLTRTVRGFSNSPEENVARIQFEWLLEKANSVFETDEYKRNTTPGIKSIPRYKDLSLFSMEYFKV